MNSTSKPKGTSKAFWSLKMLEHFICISTCLAVSRCLRCHQITGFLLNVQLCMLVPIQFIGGCVYSKCRLCVMYGFASSGHLLIGGSSLFYQ